jgi:3-oxoacyl-[acyl-carrier protein] reductase
MKILVLGAKGAIGGAITEHFRAEGHEVLAVGRKDFDLESPDQIGKFFKKVSAEFDVLIHSAGHNVPKEFDALTDVEVRQSLDANLHGFLNVTRHCLPYWRENGFGRIVVISSLYGFLGRRGRLPYVISKHALNGAVKTLAIELASIGVLVNSVSPGYIETELTYRNNSSEDIQGFTKSIPVGRLGRPEEIARAVSFLASKLNTYISGHDLIVDGAFSVGGFQ